MPRGQYDRNKAKRRTGTRRKKGGLPEGYTTSFFAVLEERPGQRPKIMAAFGDGGEAIKLNEYMRDREQTMQVLMEKSAFCIASVQSYATADEVIKQIEAEARIAGSPRPRGKKARAAGPVETVQHERVEG